MGSREDDWFRQAERDLQLAIDLKERGYHEWSCFAAHQAAEKAVKALHLHHGQEAWGHLVAKLLRELPLEVPEDLIEHYGKVQSEDGVKHAGTLVDYVRSQMAVS